MVEGQFEPARSALDIFVKDMGLVDAAAGQAGAAAPPPAGSTSAATTWAWGASTTPCF
jgi:3-hydroxyisobutyrate dehydrogenase-like beta-hydroxyacid dehydrogenase